MSIIIKNPLTIVNKVGETLPVYTGVYRKLNVSLINFTVNDVTYQAEEGMTWEEWVNSDYNNSVYELNSGMQYIELANGTEYAVGYEWEFIKATDVIESKDYTHIYMGTGGSN